MGSRPRLVWLVSEDWYFRLHFLHWAEAARDAGFDVHLIARTGERGPEAASEIRDAGFAVHEIDLRRSGLNPFDDLRARRQILRLYRDLAPDIVQHVAIKPVLHGQWAARRLGIQARVNLIPGLGYVFSSRTAKARLLRPMVTSALGRALSREDGIMVLNEDDRTFLAVLAGVPNESVSVVPGIGVDVERFHPTPEPDGPVTIALVARMLRDKGVIETVEAVRGLSAAGKLVRLRLIGGPDPGNPESISEDRLKAWGDLPYVDYVGPVVDVASEWAKAHIACLPSQYREGLPTSLSEAAACGRPIVTTDTPGCRDVVRDGETGYLVPPSDTTALSVALDRLVSDPELRQRMGAAARADAEARFSRQAVLGQVIALYRRLLR